MIVHFDCSCVWGSPSRQGGVGSEGRCPECGGVVRLSPGAPFPPARPEQAAPAPDAARCTPGQVLLAGIIGTPLASCLLLAWNFAAAGRRAPAALAVLVGALLSGGTILY